MTHPRAPWAAGRRQSDVAERLYRPLRQGWLGFVRAATVAGVAAATVAVGAPADAAPPVTLTLATVPATPGAVFLLDGQALPTDRTGSVKITLAHSFEGHRLAIRTTTVRTGDRESRFVRWWGQRRHEQDLSPTINGLQLRRDLRVQAAFEVHQEVRFRFTDQSSRGVPSQRVTSVTLRSDAGNDQTIRGATATRLLSVRPVLQDSTLLAHPVLYSVQSVVIDGSNVVNAGAHQFRPTQRTDLTLALLLRRMHLRPRDFVFGHPVGSAVEVTYPDGRLHRYGLDPDGTLALEDLARGEYLVRVDAPGYSPGRPVALSRNQDVPLPVVTRLNFALLGAILVALALGLVVLGRPDRSRQLAGRARRRLLPARDSDGGTDAAGAASGPDADSDPSGTAGTVGAKVTPAGLAETETTEDQNRVGAG